MTVTTLPGLRALGPRVPAPDDPPWPLALLGRPPFSIVVAGLPAPQGSKTAGVNPRTGKVFMRESSAAVAPWRSAVGAAALTVLPAGWEPLDGPLVADMIFTMPRPASAPKRTRALPCKVPDLDKLLRSTGDALTDTRVIADDARIVTYRRADKLYERDPYDGDALRHPGAVIRVWTLPAQAAR